MVLLAMSRPRQLGLACSVTLLLLAAGIAYNQASRRRALLPPERDLVYLPRTSALRAASLGHPELMADLVFIRTITYFGTQVASDKSYEWLPRHLETIVELDPWFRTAYRFGGLVTMYNGGPITNTEVLQSIHFLEMGLERFPADWEMAFMLGCDYLFELKTDDPAQRDRWRRAGAEWIRRAAIAGGGPSWLPSLAATIMSKEGQTEAALRYLEEAYLTAPDDRTREEVGRLLAAKRKSSIEALAAARDRFTAGWKHVVPYAPADFYVLLGDAPSPRMDWRYLVASAPIERALASDEGAAVTP